MTDNDFGPLEDQHRWSAHEPARADPKRRRWRLATLLTAMLLPIAVAPGVVGAVPWLVPEQTAQGEASESVSDELRAQGERLDQVVEELESTNGRLSRVESTQAELSDRLDALGESIEQSTGERAAEAERTGEPMREAIAELQAQIQQLRERQGDQRELGGDIQRRLLLMEATSLLALGKARAELSDDINAALEAYRQADDLVGRADDPGLVQVRRLLAQELDTLENLSVPDWLDLQSRIQRQARGVGDWPIVQTAPANTSMDDDGNAEPDGWIASTRDALGGLVRVSPRTSPTMSDHQVATLREMARLRWLAAELAIARRDTAELDHHLRSLERLIADWFDDEASGVQTARRLIDEVEAMEVSPMPDTLGQALTALRLYLESA